MIGDRPDTDIKMGKDGGISTCLVMTGVVEGEEDYEKNWKEKKDCNPDFIMQSFG